MHLRSKTIFVSADTCSFRHVRTRQVMGFLFRFFPKNKEALHTRFLFFTPSLLSFFMDLTSKTILISADSFHFGHDRSHQIVGSLFRLFPAPDEPRRKHPANQPPSSDRRPHAHKRELLFPSGGEGNRRAGVYGHRTDDDDGVRERI
jgi:hypothetical protein